MDTRSFRGASAAAPLSIALATLFALSSCGGQDESEMLESEPEARSSGGERSSASDGMQITGLMGTIPQREVEGALAPRMSRFGTCFERRSNDVEVLAGEIRLSFRIHTDGSVAWVFPSESSVGDREVERCVVDVARAIRFSRPRGGEAEFSYRINFDADDHVRPPLNWAADALGDVSRQAAQVRGRCGIRGAVRVTLYIEPGGRVLAAGGSASDAESEATLDCVLEAVRGWSLPDPGSYPAKVTFDVR